MKTIRPLPYPIRRGGTGRWLFGISLLFGITSLNAQQTDTASYSFSVQQSVDYALQNSTSMKNIVLEQEAAADKVKEVTGLGLPQINGSAQVQDYLEIPTSFIPGEFFGGQPGTFIPVQFGTKYSATAGFSATQLIFNGDYFVGLKAAKTYQELAQKNVARTKIETTCDVTKAYYTALVNAQKKALLDANLAKVKKLMDDTKALFKNGFVEKIDVDRITVAYNNLQTEVTNVNRLLDLSIVLLKYQIGMDQSAKLTLTDSIESITFVAEQPSSEKFDYNKRVEYQLMNLALAGKVLSLKSERVGYLPTFALFASCMTNAQRTKFDFFDTHQRWYPIIYVGVQMNVPIFDGLQRYHRIQQAKIGVIETQNQLVFMQRTIDMQQAVAKVNLQNSAASLQSQKDNMTLAQDVFDVAQKKYDQGVGSNLEVINAQTALKEAQTNYFNALYDALIAKVEYDKSIGSFVK